MAENDDIYFETYDHNKKKVVCTKEQWFNHILIEHKYMENQEASVKDTLQNPDFGIRHYDVDYSRRRIYYQKSKKKDYYTKVVVEFNNAEGEGNGRIITAFLPDNIKKGETPELLK